MAGSFIKMITNEASISGYTNHIFTITVDPTTLVKKPETNYEVGIIRNNIKLQTGVTIPQFSTIVSAPQSYTWFGGALKGPISNENWHSQSVFGLDFDKGLVSVEEVIQRFHQYEIYPQLWYYSLSDTDLIRKFRVVLFLDEPVQTKEQHEHILKGLLVLFPEADPKCKNQGRFFFGGKQSFILHKEPISKTRLIDILATIIIIQDGGKTRHIPKDLASQPVPEKSAPNQHFLYYLYRSCHFFPNPETKKSTSLAGSPSKIELDFNEARKKVRILDEFLSGTWLYHDQIFGLATNLQYIRGGQKLMLETMKNFNDLGLTHYTDNNFSIFPYLKKVNYRPQLIKNFSPYEEDTELYDIVTATKEVRGKIEVVEPIQKIPLKVAENQFKTEFDRVKSYGLTGKIYLFKLPTAIGKTSAITSSVGTTIAAPTNDLKNEISGRMKVVHQTTPDSIIFQTESLNNKLNYYYSIGLPVKATAVLHDVVNGTGLVKYPVSDLTKANEYLNQLRNSYKTDQTILTTHARALSAEFKNDTLIFDEDPINSLISIKSLEISDLVKLEINTGCNNTSLTNTISLLKSLIPGEIRKTPLLSVDLDDLIEQISQTRIETDIFSFFDSTYMMKDPRIPNLIHYVVKKDIPVNKKVIILSATIPTYIYQKLFGNRVEIIDISDVEQMGEIIQYTKRSCSRNGLTQYHRQISEQVGSTPVITFKSFQHQFKNPVKEMYFGNCSGYDSMKGQDLAVVGTPHRDNVQYLLTASVLGIDFRTTDTTMTHQKTEYNGFRFWIKCYDHPELRNIQLSFIESDLIQAIGRARTLRTHAKVEVYSNYPLRITDQFLY